MSNEMTSLSPFHTETLPLEKPITIEYLYETRVISAAQLIRIRLFLEQQVLWLGTVRSTMEYSQLEKDVVRRIDVYLWCVDPIIQRHPKRIAHLARLWIEKKIVDMNPTTAADLIDDEMSY